MEALRQISDGSIDDVEFLNFPSDFVHLEIKEEVSENNEYFTNEDIKVKNEYSDDNLNSDTVNFKKISKDPDWDLNVEYLAEPRNVTKSKEKLFTCVGCDINFKHKRSLQNHVERVHEGKTVVKNLTCEGCNKKFKFTSQLKNHFEMVHEGKKPVKKYSCEECKKDFVSKSVLNQHILGVHEKKKPWKCDICHKDFSQKCSRDWHIARVHETNNKSFKCEKCNKSFTFPSELKQHIENFHENKKPRKKYFCLVCEKEVLTGKVDHIKKYHSEKDGDLQCPKCDKKFPTFTELG